MIVENFGKRVLSGSAHHMIKYVRVLKMKKKGLATGKEKKKIFPRFSLVETLRDTHDMYVCTGKDRISLDRQKMTNRRLA